MATFDLLLCESLGFAFALSSAEVYRQLREDSNTLDLHLFEITQHAFLALRLAQSDPPSLSTAEALAEVITHLQRMMTSPAIVKRLMQPNTRRPAFSEGGLDSFTRWLFDQCMQPKAHARKRATELFSALASQLHAQTCRTQSSGGRRGGGSSGGGSSGGGSERGGGGGRDWVISVYGNDPMELPVVKLFTHPARSADDATAAADDNELVNAVEGHCPPGAWAALAARCPQATDAQSSPNPSPHDSSLP